MDTFDKFFYGIIITMALLALMFGVAAIKVADTIQERGLKNIVNEVWEGAEYEAMNTKEKTTFELYCESVYKSLPYSEAQRETRANGYECPQNY